MNGKHWGSLGGPFKIEDLAGLSLGRGASRSESHIYFYSDVTQDSIQELNTHLREGVVEMKQLGIEYGIDPPPLHLHIHSDGGDVFAGMAGLDTILELRQHVPIHTHIEGSAASAATLLSVAGNYRTIGANSFILIHPISSEFWGKYEEWKDEMRNHDLLMKTIVDFYASNTKMGLRKVKSALKKDLWFSADVAMECGLVDEVR